MNITSGLSYLLKGGYYNIYETLYTKFFGSCFYFLLPLHETKRIRKSLKHILKMFLRIHFVSIFGPGLGVSILSERVKIAVSYCIVYTIMTILLFAVTLFKKDKTCRGFITFRAFVRRTRQVRNVLLIYREYWTTSGEKCCRWEVIFLSWDLLEYRMAFGDNIVTCIWWSGRKY
jgi:hypothetical protein